MDPFPRNKRSFEGLTKIKTDRIRQLMSDNPGNNTGDIFDAAGFEKCAKIHQ